MEFKDRLRQAREWSGKTQQGASELLGWKADSSYRQYELGKKMPTAPMLAALADGFNVSADWLLGLSSDPEIHSRIPLEPKD